MDTANPGQITTLAEAGLPTGATVGFQVIRAASGLVAIARTTAGVIERPVGSGNYVINFNAPPEGDLYLVVVDWTDGVLAPETTRVRDLQVTTTVLPGSSGLGAIADYVLMHLGGETWNALKSSPNYGETQIVLAIETVKARVMATPPPTAVEGDLPALVKDYLGICSALALIPAARDLWGSAELSRVVGDEAKEIVTYVNRANMMDDLAADLMKRLPSAQALAIPLLDTPVLLSVDDGPSIDEEDDCRVTADPRAFPTADEFGSLLGDRHILVRRVVV